MYKYFPVYIYHCLIVYFIFQLQLWKVTENEDIRMLDGCLDYEKSQVVMLPCSDKKSQKWNRQVKCSCDFKRLTNLEEG